MENKNNTFSVVYGELSDLFGRLNIHHGCLWVEVRIFSLNYQRKK